VPTAKRTHSRAAKLDETEMLTRLKLVGESFRPAAPIDRRSLFSGRAEQIAELFSIAAQPGQHALIYGERGVGKTSLAAVTASMLGSANLLCTRATCDVSDDFGSVWRKALGELRMQTSRPGVGFASSSVEHAESASRLLGNDPVTPNDVRSAVDRAARQQELVVFIDEFDRLRDADARVLFADTIKTLSDRVTRATIVLIGVADSVGELIREHRSVERALAQIHMPRMTREELSAIVTSGMEASQMTIKPAAVAKIAALSQGLPHYTQLLGQLAAQAALSRRVVEVETRDVDAAVRRALDRAQQSVVEAYEQATLDTRRSMYPQVLLACALAPDNDFGLFTPGDVREPLSRILGKPTTTASYSRHLEELADTSRGGVLQKQGSGRTSRFRFADPLLQPYVAMQGVAQGIVRLQDLPSA
jgi:Cdc6-like AAA superfamily ATPase